MKYGIVFFTTLFFFGCSTIKVTEKSTIDEPGIYYHLPKTTLQIDIESTVITSTAGVYGEFAKELLNISPNTDTIKHIPTKITITSISLPDEHALYYVKSKGGLLRKRTLAVKKTTSGIIKSVNAESKSITPEISTKILKVVSTATSGIPLMPDLGKIKAPKIANDSADNIQPEDIKENKEILQFRIDSVRTLFWDSIKQHHPDKILRALRSVRYNSALLIARKIAVLDSLKLQYTECDYCENTATIESSLAIIDSTRKEYLEMFTGTKKTQEFSSRIFLSDSLEKEGSIKSELFARNRLTFNIHHLSTATLLGGDHRTEQGFAYRIPNTILLTLTYEKNNVLLEEYRQIALAGKNNIARLHKRKSRYALTFDEYTGALTEIISK